MAEQQWFSYALVGWSLLALATFGLLLWIDAPYGRHERPGWGPTIPARYGWLLMEAPSAALMAVFFALGDRRDNLVAWVFLGLWQAHYLYRAFVFPWRLRASQRRMPLLIALMAIGFNLGNCYFNGRWLFALGPLLPDSWLVDGRFLGGLALMLAGVALNQHADQTLLGLRRPGESGYQIPRGGLYRWVSCPNYLGEIIEWCGWALLTWSGAGLAFALWTVANLAPRARAHHRWYRQRFADYPPERRALLPGLW